MSRWAYVNGRYVPHREASVHVEDRGYQFADGVYEVVLVHAGAMIDEIPHLDRLDRSLDELRIDPPMGRMALRAVLREVVRRNRIRTGLVYLQITRGVARRDHAFPTGVKPALVVTAKRLTLPRCDIKSVSLLPNVLGKQHARENGAYEAWQIDQDGNVTEGTSSNSWIVTHDDRLLTRPATHEILNGITRQTILKLAAARGLTFEERAFSLDEALAAREAFISSATSFVTPVTQIDDTTLGNGRAGSFTMDLRSAYFDYMAAAAPV